MIPIVLFATAFLVRAAVGAAFPGPAYPDSYYYAHVGDQLASGLGLTSQFIWNLDDIGGHIPADAALPVSANALWMPLAELIQFPFLVTLGTGAIAAGLAFWIVGALAAPLTWFIGRDAGFDKRPAFAAALMVAVPGGLTPFLSQPDNFGLFMTLGALALWLCARGARGDRRAFVLGGLVVGLATLARSDGILLGLPFAIVGVRELVRRIRGSEVKLSPAAVVGCAALFAVAVAPWLYRQVEVFGSLFPAASSGRLMWLTDYQQLFSFTNPPTLDTWLAQGFTASASSRLDGLLSAVGLFVYLPLVVFLVPFALIGVWARRRDAAFAPFFIYAVALFAVMSLVFSVLVPHGTFIHSAVALVPHTFLLVTAGVASSVAWVARRRPTWDRSRATAVFTYGAVVVLVLAAGFQTFTTLSRWAQARSVQQKLARVLQAMPAADRVMAANPGAVQYLSGKAGLVTPNDSLATIESAMRAYDVRWLVLERDAIVPALEPVLAGDVRPAWLSQPVAVVPARHEPDATAAALYAVCLSDSDTRCDQ